jgi:hypothetical protein
MFLRLRRLPDGARQLVASLSVVPDGLCLHELAALAELDEEVAAVAAAELRKAESSISPTACASPIPCTTTSPRRSGGGFTWRAARMQADRGRPATEVAVHLLEVEPRGDAWVTQTLRDAARAAGRARDFKGAEHPLLRAQREGADGDRAELLAETRLRRGTDWQPGWHRGSRGRDPRDRGSELAAGGNTNRDIAQSLFVTQKTVETHLGHVYDKLGVRSRHKLHRALEAGEISLPDGRTIAFEGWLGLIGAVESALIPRRSDEGALGS